MSTTREIIERLKACKSPRLTSDNQVAAVLGVTRQAVSRWQKGHDAMSLHVLNNARDVLKLTDAEYVEYGLQLTAERNKRLRHDAEFWDQVLRIWKKGVRKSAIKLTSILLVGLGLFAAHGKASATVLDVELVGNCQTDSLYIMRNSTRRRRRLGKLWGCLKSQVLAPLQSATWARIRSAGSTPVGSPLLPAYT